MVVIASSRPNQNLVQQLDSGNQLAWIYKPESQAGKSVTALFLRNAHDIVMYVLCIAQQLESIVHIQGNAAIKILGVYMGPGIFAIDTYSSSLVLPASTLLFSQACQISARTSTASFF